MTERHQTALQGPAPGRVEDVGVHRPGVPAAAGLVARFRIRTASSVSFDLGTKGDTLHLPGRRGPRVVGPGRVFDIVGWLDAHHPCEGFHRLLLRIGLPEPYVCWESMRDLVPQVKAALGLPAADSYRVSLVSLSRMTSTEEPQYGAVSKTGGGGPDAAAAGGGR